MLRDLRLISGFILSALSLSVHGLDLDWSGQFQSESHVIYNYSLGHSIDMDTSKLDDGGYYIPGGGEKNAAFHLLFLKLRPSVIVNDNIYIKSEWWVGNPRVGLFGGGAPGTFDQRQYYSNQSAGSFITAQRIWAEFLSDIGTVQVGRMPLNWGLGVVWNSGEDFWSRYMTTGDAIRLVSKFGAFSVSPAFIKYSTGYSIGGSCTSGTGGNIAGICTTQPGSDDVTEYSIMFKYENLDEDLEMGLNFVRRIMGSSQPTTIGYYGVEGIEAGGTFNTWDIFARKKLGPVSLAGEAPIVSGELGGIPYKSFAIAFEGDLSVTDDLGLSLNAGYAPGQPNFSGARPISYKAFFMNPGYKVGMIMFNYQFRNFAGPNANTASTSQISPFDQPIVNATYINAGASYRFASRWEGRGAWTMGFASSPAQAGSRFFNSWDRKFYNNNAGKDQSSSLGWEADLGTTFHWDDQFKFHFDVGLFVPGDFYRFSNTAVDNAIAPVWAGTLRVGVGF